MTIRRVLVIDNSGAGKSTVAEEISRKLSLPFVPTDPIYWRENWQSAPNCEVCDAIDEITKAEEWVLDGNFDAQRALIWPRADLILWLDLPKLTVVSRVAMRNLSWMLVRRAVWSENLMTFNQACSGIRHSWRGYDAKSKNYPAYLAELKEVSVVRLGSQNEIDVWLAQLAPEMEHQVFSQ